MSPQFCEVLIFFIHHIAASIQASSIIASVTKETLEAMDRLFPEKLGRGPRDTDADNNNDNDSDGEAESSQRLLQGQNWQSVLARHNGYLQGVDDETLLRLANEHRTIVRMERGIGEFVVENTPLVSLALDSPPDSQTMSALRAAYSIDRFRTVHQDCGFGVRQLVDMALRALSPGINDTTTTVMCVDYLTAILARLASRDIPASHRYEDGELRLISMGQTFASLAAESFDEIRVSSSGNVAVMLKMLDALQTVAGLTDKPSRRQVLCEQLECIVELAERSIESPRDMTRFQNRLEQVNEVL